MSFSIERFPSGPLATNTYVLFSLQEAVVIDPGLGCEKEVVPFLHKEKLTLSAIWITHSHLDHFAGCSALVKKTNTKVIVHAFDAHNLTQPGSDLIDLWMPCEKVSPSIVLQAGEILHCGESLWSVLHTPGHSPGSVCFYNAEHHALFSGDTLFRGTYGKCTFPTSDPTVMAESMKLLASLPEETVVYPGHGPQTTIGREKHWMANRF